MVATRNVNTTQPSGPVDAQLPPENISISSGGPWRRFFEALWRRLGAFQDDVFNGFVDGAGIQARIYQLQQEIQDANFEAAAARQLVFSLLADRREIEELRFAVATAQQQTASLSQLLVRSEEARAQDHQQSSFQSQSLVQQAAVNKFELDHKVAEIIDGEAGLTTDAVDEGLTNLYSTPTRSRAALSVSAGAIISYNSASGVFSTNPTTGWTAPTGTAQRSGFATYTAPVISAGYVQAEVQAIANSEQATSRTLKALIDDLTSRSVLAP